MLLFHGAFVKGYVSRQLANPGSVAASMISWLAASVS